jgi:ribosomal protein S18 acetylase RimI-like enzyme
MRVRPAEPRDADALVEGNVRMAQETEGLALDRAVTAAGVRAALADPARGRYFVVEAEAVVVGQLMITLEWSDWRNGWYWWIQSVWVHPAHRGRGVYRALHEHVVAAARREGVRSVRLYVERENQRARAVYEALGMLRSHYELYELEPGSGG